MGRLALLGAAMAAVLAVLMSGTGLAAAAGGNPGNPSPPGQEHTPPGQAAKANEDPGEPAPSEEHGNGKHAKSSGPTENATPAGQSATVAADLSLADSEAVSKERADNEAVKKEHPDSAAVKKEHPDTPSAAKSHPAPEERTVVAKPAKDVASRGRSATAHQHVIICHRTGSSSNPYVVINISMSAWLHGHSTHPDLDGRSDILLKQGAAPGEKLSVSACGVPGVRPTDPGTPPGSKQDPGQAVPTVAVSVTSVSAPPARATVSRGSKPHRKPAGHRPLGAGHLGYVAVQGTLPFTGVPLWIVVLAACALLGGGLAIRRSFRTEPAEARVTDQE